MTMKQFLDRSLWHYSNLQPSGYERRNRTGKFSNNRHFCARSLPFVRVWLRRFVGYSLVECGREQCHYFGESTPPRDRSSVTSAYILPFAEFLGHGHYCPNPFSFVAESLP